MHCFEKAQKIEKKKTEKKGKKFTFKNAPSPGRPLAPARQESSPRSSPSSLRVREHARRAFSLQPQNVAACF
jgi:hypothetical protein